MDEGQFERSRLVFWLWLAVPIGLMVAAMLPSRFYLDRSRRMLAERRVMLRSIDPLEDRLRSVDGLLKSLLSETSHGVEATDAATRRINQAAQRTGFSVRTLTVEKTLGESDRLRTLRISVQGQGTLLSAIQWLDALQAPGLLLRVETANVTALGVPSNSAIAGDFTLVLYLRPS